MSQIAMTAQMPRRIAALPRHRGLPVPAMVQFDAEGVPDFKVIDMEKWIALVRARGCGICGATIGARAWFVGGPACFSHRLFTDLPMHEDCAHFALQTCPYLALPRYRFIMSEVALGGVTVNVNEAVATRRPNRFGLGCASAYKLAIFEGGSIPMLHVPAFSTVEWWRHGQRIEAE
jgi:hypothetical protein